MARNNHWARRVGAVFNPLPRIGGQATVWLERRGASERLAEAFNRPGHVCLDGPSGAGKTSLILTHVLLERIRHIPVMATASMTWTELCRRLMAAPNNKETMISAGAEVGIDKGLPTAKFRVSLGEKGRPIDDVNLIEKLASTWTEHDVAKRVSELDAAVIIDDLEQASDDLLRRIADLCKLLTQEYVSENAKLVLVGSDDIYQRIHRLRPALEDRIAQVSLGAFKYPSDARHFLILGLNKLKRFHPWNSTIRDEFEKRDKCQEAVWEAADGLPKSLNSLGYDIAMRSEHRNRVSANDVIEVARRMTENHWLLYGKQFPQILEYLESNAAAIALIRCLYEDGVAGVHMVPSLLKRISSRSDAPDHSSIDAAIDGFASLGFLVRTGVNGEKLFVKQPTVAHTLGVVMREPSRFKAISEVVSKRRVPIQLAFPLPIQPAPDEMDTPSYDV